MPMRIFFRVSLVYALVGLGVVLPFHDNLNEFGLNAIAAIAAYALLMQGSAIWFLPIVFFLPFVLRPAQLRKRTVAVIFAAFGCVAIQVGFTFLKSSIPKVLPFYADPYLAAFDRSCSALATAGATSSVMKVLTTF